MIIVKNETKAGYTTFEVEHLVIIWCIKLICCIKTHNKAVTMDQNHACYSFVTVKHNSKDKILSHASLLISLQ